MQKGLIGITGRAGAGKDTAASIIKQFLYSDYSLYTLAGPLKAGCSLLFGWTMDQLEDREFKEAIDPKWGFSPRRAMQLLGTEYGRTLREDLWVHMAQVQLDSPLTTGLIVTDVRFENEAEFIRKNGGTVVHISRPGATIAENTHASEAGVKFADGDVRIDNSGSFDDLRDALISALVK